VGHVTIPADQNTMKSKKNTLLNIFFVGMVLTFLIPLVYNNSIYSVFEGPKLLLFYLLIQSLFPLYIFLILKFPELRPGWKNTVFISGLVFVVLASVSSIFGEDLLFSLFGRLERSSSLFLLLHLFVYSMYLITLFSAKQKFLLYSLIVFCLVAALATLIGAMEAFHLIEPIYTDQGRASSLFGNPLFFAAYLITPLFLSLFLAQQYKKKTWLRFAFSLNSIFIFYGIWLAKGTGPLLGVCCGLLLAGLLFFLVGATKKRLLATLGILLLLVVSSGIYGISILKLNEHESLHDALYDISYSATTRYDQWVVAVKGFPEFALLGTGLENYYVVSQKYFDTRQYETTFSYADKPHNYPLELFVTTGTLGGLSYLLLIAFVFAALWQAYKKEVLDKTEASLLSGGIAAYFIQNLFLFDTIAAAITFWFFVGFAGFLKKASLDQKKTKVFSDKTTIASTGIAGVISILLLLFIVFPLHNHYKWMQKTTNAIKHSDHEAALVYLEKIQVANKPFDQTNAVDAYSNLVKRISGDPEFSQEQKEQAYQQAISMADIFVAQRPDYVYPYLQNISILNTYAKWKNEPVDSKAYDYANTVFALSPLRSEGYLMLTYLYITDGEKEKALEAITQGYEISGERQPNVLWMYALAGYSNTEDATIYAPLGYHALQYGITINEPSATLWIVDYYIGLEDLETALDIYERITKMYPSSPDFLPNLASTYAVLGRYDEARATAEKLRILDPSQSDAIDLFLTTLSE
jgi:O-antigen ligase